ncbi:hypothetical protein AB0919_17745 [Streptomyces sp. NPDC046994]|uniref:hypothetical protein n=1 Tax=Streptomyces sp. NPDC046994 TaxID=3155735 RepID=UPI003453AE47
MWFVASEVCIPDAHASDASGPHPAHVRTGQKCDGGTTSANLHRSGRTWGQHLLVGEDQRVSQLGCSAEADQGLPLVQRPDLVGVLPARLIEHTHVESCDHKDWSLPVEYLNAAGDALADPEAGNASGLCQTVHPRHIQKVRGALRPGDIAAKPADRLIDFYASS